MGWDFSPQVKRIARALGDSPLLVCEDTMVPTESCTPELIDAHYKICGNKPQWLGIYLKPKRYVHDLGGRRFAAQAVAGSKMFYANEGCGKGIPRERVWGGGASHRLRTIGRVSVQRDRLYRREWFRRMYPRALQRAYGSVRSR